MKKKNHPTVEYRPKIIYLLVRSFIYYTSTIYIYTWRMSRLLPYPKCIACLVHVAPASGNKHQGSWRMFPAPKLPLLTHHPLVIHYWARLINHYEPLWLILIHHKLLTIIKPLLSHRSIVYPLGMTYDRPIRPSGVVLPPAAWVRRAGLCPWASHEVHHLANKLMCQAMDFL